MTTKPAAEPKSDNERKEDAKMIAGIASEKYPYLENPDNDLGIREWNQRMYDKREAFIDGYILASELF